AGHLSPWADPQPSHGLTLRGTPSAYPAAMRQVRAVREWAAASPLLLDSILAVLAWLVCLVMGGTSEGAALLTTAQVLPLAVRRVQPFLAGLVIAAACLLQLFMLDHPLLSNVAALAIMYAAAAHAPERWQTVTIGTIGLVGSVLGALDWVLAYEI